MTQGMRTSLLITAGNGPAECNLAVAGVLRRMQEEVEAYGLTLDVSADLAKHAMRSAVVVMHGEHSGCFARRWEGTIRWRAKSTLRPNHKRANWFVGVFPLAQTTAAKSVIHPNDVTYESFRAGGPGGQHQNTTDSAVRATHRPSGLTTVAREMRSQHRNKALALDRLHILMTAQAVADQESRKVDQNQLHSALERGNPVRCFKGNAFREEKCR